MNNFPTISSSNHHIPQNRSAITVDVEDWFHILDSLAVPSIEQWPSLESRIEGNLERFLELFASCSVRVTFFWLGWVAERHKDLIRKCQEAGHEIASHGYGHLLAYEIGQRVFSHDISRAKAILEDITGEPIRGFRAPGFGITDKALWAFEVIREAGYQYDSSVFPARRSHGGISQSPLGLYVIKTKSGDLVEIPQSMVELAGRRISFFGGGYLRLSPKWLIKLGIKKLHKTGRSLIVYVHPREIDPDHPRLLLPLWRRFKYYVNLKSTLPKLEWLCRRYTFVTMREMVYAMRAREVHDSEFTSA